ncbi:Protein of uncharacterised function (DUF3326) [Burkholderia pseudomallei]|nr:Protein of uncharacterised function (DUF3326) [Burkholderia pseudomallei]
MHIHEKAFSVSGPLASASLDHLRELTRQQLGPDETPVRFVVTRSDEHGFDCEIGVLSDGEMPESMRADGLFRCERRTRGGGGEFNAVLIVPTGVGAEIGGHDGDAGPVAMLLSSICDRLITHPNVVNAADINELPANGLYVEGSVICRLLLGQIGLQPVRANRVLAVVGSNECPTFVNAAINAVNAARAAYGLDCPRVLHLDPGIRLTSTYASSGRAAGTVENLDALVALLAEHRDTFDAVAIASHIHVPDACRTGYYAGTLGLVNPWGGVEAMLTHTISTLFSVPSAHSPMYEDPRFAVRDYGIVDPRIAPEVVSLTFLQCILKGLRRAPHRRAGARGQRRRHAVGVRRLMHRDSAGVRRVAGARRARATHTGHRGAREPQRHAQRSAQPAVGAGATAHRRQLLGSGGRARIDARRPESRFGQTAARIRRCRSRECGARARRFVDRDRREHRVT